MKAKDNLEFKSNNGFKKAYIQADVFVLVKSESDIPFAKNTLWFNIAKAELEYKGFKTYTNVHNNNSKTILIRDF